MAMQKRFCKWLRKTGFYMATKKYLDGYEECAFIWLRKTERYIAAKKPRVVYMATKNGLLYGYEKWNIIYR